MKEKTKKVFETMSVPRAVFSNAIPAMAAMIMVLIYNLADTFFIGQTHDDLLVAAVSLATPVFLLFMAVGTAFGIGGTSVISRALGEQRHEYARKVSSFCMWGCVLTGVVMAALFLLFMDPILSLIGASPATWQAAKSYLVIVSLSGPFVLISSCFSNVIRTEGEAGKAMTGQVLGNLINVILDPLLILVCGWGIAGAAAATVIGNVCSALYYVFYFLSGKSSLSIHPRDFSCREKIFSSVLSIGLPASLGSVLMSVCSILINSQMMEYGDMAVAGMGVAMKVTTISVMLLMGLGQGIQPLLGYCVGARLWERFRSIFRYSMTVSIVLGVVLTAICYLFCPQIISMFLTDTEAYGYALDFARILLSTSALFGIYYVLTNALQAMGAAGASLLINVSRQGLLFIPAMFLLKSVLGLTGLVWAQPAADVLSLLLAFLLYRYEYQKLAAGACGSLQTQSA